VAILVGCVAATGCGKTKKDVRPSDSAGSAGRGGSVSAGDPRATAGAAASDTLRRPTVLFVGTSLTAGLGLDPEDAYPVLVSHKADSAGLRYEFVNAGLSGETSAGALRRIDWLLRGAADVVVLETGANDGLRGLDVDSTAANIRAVVAKIRAAKPGATIVLVQMEAPPNLGGAYTAAFRRMYRDIAAQDGLVLMPFLLDRVAGIGKLNQGDGIHPNEEGEAIVADNVWRTLQPVLDSLDRTRRGS
jgi:acyl-CoA thioesterase-1